MSKYGCQQYTNPHLCRYDRRAADRKCDGCPRTTDQEYLQTMGLWVNGISHQAPSRTDGMDALDGEIWSAEAMARFNSVFAANMIAGHGEK